MLVQDVMTKNVVTIPADTSLAEAKRIMQQKRLKRLPVVEKGLLLGVVTEQRLDHLAPGKATTLTLWEVGYLLENTPVAKIMQQEVVTVTPDMTVEKALATAQSNRVGSLVVLDPGRKVVGIITTNDFFYKIANKVLGLGEPGCRIQVEGGGEAPELGRILSLVNGRKERLVTLHILDPSGRRKKKDVVLHLAVEDPREILEDLSGAGFSVSVRQR
ncbi:MAG: CBS domain-containing protein [Proteobacteria bacterium]|nr:CBS domain-containing protein [Pseudomonadota bacterium]